MLENGFKTQSEAIAFMVERQAHAQLMRDTRNGTVGRVVRARLEAEAAKPEMVLDWGTEFEARQRKERERAQAMREAAARMVARRWPNRKTA